jgi:hypothetical protein
VRTLTKRRRPGDLPRSWAGLTLAEAAAVVLFEATGGGWDEAAIAAGLDECELAVRLWRRDPRRFGLRGFEDRHPDRKVVSATLPGPAGSKGHGYVERCGAGRVRLTLDGLDKAGLLEAAVAGEGGA